LYIDENGNKKLEILKKPVASEDLSDDDLLVELNLNDIQNITKLENSKIEFLFGGNDFKKFILSLPLFISSRLNQQSYDEKFEQYLEKNIPRKQFKPSDLKEEEQTRERKEKALIDDINEELENIEGDENMKLQKLEDINGFVLMAKYEFMNIP